MPFYRRRWEEPRGDDHNDWGNSTWYFWVDNGAVEAQIEKYDNGVTLAYDRYHREDSYGFLTQETLNPTEWDGFEIDIATYQSAVDGQPFNRR